MSCSSTHKLVALVACGRGLDLGAVWVVGRCDGLYRVHTHASPAVPCFMGDQWEMVCCMATQCLMTMVIFTMYQTHNLETLPTVAESDGRAWDSAVS